MVTPATLEPTSNLSHITFTAGGLHRTGGRVSGRP